MKHFTDDHLRMTTDKPTLPAKGAPNAWQNIYLAFKNESDLISCDAGGALFSDAADI